MQDTTPPTMARCVRPAAIRVLATAVSIYGCGVPRPSKVEINTVSMELRTTSSVEDGGFLLIAEGEIFRLRAAKCPHDVKYGAGYSQNVVINLEKWLNIFLISSRWQFCRVKITADCVITQHAILVVFVPARDPPWSLRVTTNIIISSSEKAYALEEATSGLFVPLGPATYGPPRSISSLLARLD
jgi:hypothetical protein